MEDLVSCLSHLSSLWGWTCYTKNSSQDLENSVAKFSREDTMSRATVPSKQNGRMTASSPTPTSQYRNLFTLCDPLIFL